MSSLSSDRRRRARSRTAALVAAVAALVWVSVSEVATAQPRVVNDSPPPINLRYGLGVEDVELAILLAIADPPEPPTLTPGQEITDELLSKILGGRRGARRAGNPWSFESREPEHIFAAYERGNVYMRVAIRFDDQLVMLRIVASRNLGQSGNRINDEAFTLLAELDRRIRRTVLVVAQRNRYGAPIPAAPARGEFP
jgi:hypothetical protein